MNVKQSLKNRMKQKIKNQDLELIEGPTQYFIFYKLGKFFVTMGTDLEDVRNHPMINGNKQTKIFPASPEDIEAAINDCRFV